MSKPHFTQYEDLKVLFRRSTICLKGLNSADTASSLVKPITCVISNLNFLPYSKKNCCVARGYALYGEYTYANWEPELEINTKGDINNLLGRKLDILNECSPAFELWYVVEIENIYNPEKLNKIISSDGFIWNSEEGYEVMKNISVNIIYSYIKDITE